MEIGSERAKGWRNISARSVSCGPINLTGIPNRRAAWIAPSTSGLGARSEPIASRAMTPGMEWLFGFLHFEYFSPLIVTALGTRAMSQFSLVTIRTLGNRPRRPEIVGATGAGALLGVS